jgi:DNA mismatch repair ATPase MutS
VFYATGLGHPLIPDGERVCNDLTVHTLGEVAVITGSNMAGKSVFLKTVGMNLALAYAGGAVCAQQLETVLFRLFTCLGISDSVTDGISYFYAEVKRLKALLVELEREHALPLWFAIDEIFRGTNNRERLLGSRAYLRALIGQYAIGFIATHDLELATLADELSQVRNYHFRDQVKGDRMAFDYTLRTGPCPTTNALTIMRLEGLPVPPTESGDHASSQPI